MNRYLYLCVLLLTFFLPICLPFKQDETVEETLHIYNVSEALEKNSLLIQNLNESDFKQPASECFEGGDCLQSNGNECETNPHFCGYETNVKCIFREEEKRSICLCDDKNKIFDVDEEKCRVPCHNRVCVNGDCLMTWDNDTPMGKFCECYPGASGDLCDTVEKCESKEVDCGDDPRIECRVGSSGKTYCKCPNTIQKYDSVGKVCKDCNCGQPVFNCDYENGKKVCECPWRYYFDGDKCTDCNCGIGGDKCKGVDGAKICDCFEGYAQRLDTCELCECGPNSDNCSFDELGKKQCACKPGHLMAPSGLCTQKCNSTNQCRNGGTCDQICQCPEGTSGDFCDTVDWCAYKRCGHAEDTNCFYNRTSKGGYCKCKNDKSFYNEKMRQCDECNCGFYGRCILAQYRAKVCLCDKGYAEHLGKCKSCNCGYASTNCSFFTNGSRLCQCDEKFAHIKLWILGEDNDGCAPCDCGEHGKCHFNGAIKVCDCEDKYKTVGGQCRECDCGIFGYCEYDASRKKVCHCDYGYTSYKGKCKACSCDPPGGGRIGANCTNLEPTGNHSCKCPDGFRVLKNSCVDFNECIEYASPCGHNTKCVNLPGSYKCECRKGFEPTEPDQDLKYSGCKDINECLEPNACFSSLTTCVNKPGSYDCVCKEGYYPNSASNGPSYNPMYVSCNVKTTQWKTAAILMGILLSLAIAVTFSCIFCKD